VKHSFNCRVIYGDTDAEGVVYYANYLRWFEAGRTELLRSRGIDLNKFKDDQGIVFAVTRVECDYKAPARYDEEIEIVTAVAETSPVRIIFDQQAKKNGKLLVSARVTACALSAKDLRPIRLPPELLKG
jgi:acyl-CoA thioester hydrolase